MLNQQANHIHYTPSLISISDLAVSLHNELQFNGDSLLLEDVAKSIIDHTRLYAGWKTLHYQHQQAIANQPILPIEINSDFMLEVGEWSILEPIVRSHLEFVQAKRVEGSRAINGDMFGKDVNSAYQDYKIELDMLGQKAFVELPFSV